MPIDFLPFTNLFWIAANAAQVVALLVLVDVVVSWAMMLGARGVTPYTPWVRTLHRFTDPLLRPLRRLVPPHKFGGWDISPVIALVALQMVIQGLARAGAGW